MKARPVVVLVFDLWCILPREDVGETGWNGIVGTVYLLGLSRRSQFHFKLEEYHPLVLQALDAGTRSK